MATAPVYQLNVRLLEIKPVIWRRLLVRSSSSLAMLHGVLQTVFGWENKHLYLFEVGDRSFEAPHPEATGASASRCRLSSLGLEPGTVFSYLYDFGDDWYHKITVEELGGGLRGTETVVCVGGENSGPPEDSGGPHGYSQLLQALGRPKSPASRDRIGWLEPGFRPDFFDLKAVNRALRIANRRRGAV